MVIASDALSVGGTVDARGHPGLGDFVRQLLLSFSLTMPAVVQTDLRWCFAKFWVMYLASRVSHRLHAECGFIHQCR